MTEIAKETTTERAESNGKVVLTVEGREIEFRPEEDTRYYVGLMFFPWLNGGTHQHRGLWYFSKGVTREEPKRVIAWDITGPSFETYEEARAAMEQYNDMVRTGKFVWRKKKAAEPAAP